MSSPALAWADAKQALKPRHPARQRSKIRQPAPQDDGDYNCLVDTIAGEGIAVTKVEQATIGEGLIVSARRNGRSICEEAYARYHPRKGTPTPNIVAAAINVLWENATLVPDECKQASEFRAPKFRRRDGTIPKIKGYVFVRQFTPDGNLFFVPEQFFRPNGFVSNTPRP